MGRTLMLPAAIFLLILGGSTEAFIFSGQVHPALELISQVAPGTAFRSRLDFDYNDSTSKHRQLSIQGPVFELLNESTAKSSVPLPTANGSNAKLSTGSKCLKILKEAFIVGMQGMETVPFEKGCWEMAWMDDQRSGQLVCGFHLPLPIRRSGETITNGDTYFCFRVFTRESLAAGQEMKHEVQEQNAQALAEKDVHLEKMNSTPNLVMKAWHYRNAFAAFEKVLYAPTVSTIPDQADVIELPNGLLVTREGSMYRKGNALIGPSWLKLGKVTLMEHSFMPEDLSKLKP